MKKRVTHQNLFLVLFTSAILLTTYPINGQDPVTSDNENCYTKCTYIYKVVNNCEIRADVYKYPGTEARPAIIWIHPGALIIGNREWLGAKRMEKYLNNGYIVVSIDYRLAPETKLPAIIEDIEDAYAWVRTKGPDLFNIDPDRIAIVGHSAGGYLSLMAGIRLNPSPKALVSFYGYGDISEAWLAQPDSFYNQRPSVSKEDAYKAIGKSIISVPSERGRYQFYLYCRQQGIWPQEVTGHNPQEEPKWFYSYEPIRNVKPTYPPTLLLHGEKDTDVPFEKSVKMAEALQRDNVENELITNPEWGHMFDGQRGWEDPAVQEAYSRVLLFLEKHIK